MTECPLCSGVESECPCPKSDAPAPELVPDGQVEEEAEVVQETRDDLRAQPVEDEPAEVQPAQDDPAQEERGEPAGMGEAQTQPEGQGQESDDTPAGERVGTDQLLSLTDASGTGTAHETAPPAAVLVGVLPSLVRAVVLNRAAAHEPGRPLAAPEVMAELELRMGMPRKAYPTPVFEGPRRTVAVVDVRPQ